jgi:transposase-like protein
MLGHGAKFGHKKEQAVAALLSHRTVEEAARAVGISPNTLLRWLKKPEFQAACQNARRSASRQAIARLRDALGAAVMTLLKIMVDPNAPSGIRLRAAEIVLEQDAKYIALEEIEGRLSELERSAAETQLGEMVGEGRDRSKPRTINCAVARASRADVDKVG